MVTPSKYVWWHETTNPGPMHNEPQPPYVNRYGKADCGSYFVFVARILLTKVETEVLNSGGSIAETNHIELKWRRNSFFLSTRS